MSKQNVVNSTKFDLNSRRRYLKVIPKLKIVKVKRRSSVLEPKEPKRKKLKPCYPHSARTTRTISDGLKKLNLPPISSRKVHAVKFDELLKASKTIDKKKIVLKNMRYIKSATGELCCVGKVLGEGAFGRVHKAKMLQSKKVLAVKEIKRNLICTSKEVQRLKQELHILKTVDHPNIINFFELIEEDKALYLVIEYHEKDLFQLIVDSKELNLSDAVHYFRQMLRGVEYLHKFGIAHRDLKPENMLLNGKNLKITDFGLSARLVGGRGLTMEVGGRRKSITFLYTCCGSPAYAAPEILAGVPYDGTRSDIWSCGIILYTMLTGCLPFDNPDTSKLYESIMSLDFSIPHTVNAKAADYILQTLIFRAQERLYFPQIYGHSLFQQLN